VTSGRQSKRNRAHGNGPASPPPEPKRLGSFGGYDGYAVGDELHLVETVGEAEGQDLVRRLIELEQDPQVPNAPLQVGPYSGYLLVMAIQLTCTYPGIGDQLKGQLEELGRRMQQMFGGRMQDLLEQGWHRDHDHDRGGEGR